VHHAKRATAVLEAQIAGLCEVSDLLRRQLDDTTVGALRPRRSAYSSPLTTADPGGGGWSANSAVKQAIPPCFRRPKFTSDFNLDFAAIYTRVSAGSQTTENQLRELEAVAERHGWQVVARFTDEGISGAKGRDQHPGLNSLMEGVTRRDFDKVMAWSVDRLGRSLSDLLSVMGELKAKARPLAKRCFRCWACSANLSARLSGSASTPVSLAQRHRGRN